VPVGLKDVAQRAGVSIKTVSNVVNGYVHVRPETRDRVNAAIDALGYRPNLTARSLRGGRTGVIALAVPDLTSPYFAEIAEGVIAAAEQLGWTVLIDQTDGRRERELLVLHGIRDHLIDGVVFSPLALGDEDLRTTRSEVPIVCLGERVHAGTMDHIAIDNVAAARTATNHLIERGRRRIAAVGAQASPVAETARLRLAGYTEALEEAGLPVESDMVLAANTWHRGEGLLAAKRLIESDSRPDAIFCFNDLLALGTLHGLAELGVLVPDDIAVVGIDDIEECRYVRPTLTSISPDKDAIARESIALLAERLVQPSDTTGREVEVDFRLVTRDST
jgi:DNA-binding LacI/PurR family transcriptional regulator